MIYDCDCDARALRFHRSTIADPLSTALRMRMQAMSRDPEDPRTCEEFLSLSDRLQAVLVERGVKFTPTQESAFRQLQEAYEIPMHLGSVCAASVPTTAPRRVAMGDI